VGHELVAAFAAGDEVGEIPVRAVLRSNRSATNSVVVGK
jgi:hypothetical protein